MPCSKNSLSMPIVFVNAHFKLLLLKIHQLSWWEPRRCLFKFFAFALWCKIRHSRNICRELWCLMQHSTICLLYRGGQVYWRRPRSIRRKPRTCRKSHSLDHIMLYQVRLAMSGIRTHNFSGDWHWLHR